MKFAVLIALLIVTASCLMFRKEAKAIDDPSLPELDPRKPVFQDGVQKKLKAMDWRLMHQIELSNKGLQMVEWGCLAFAIGVAVCLAFHNALLDTIGACVGFFGGCYVGVGMGLMLITEVWYWIGYGLAIVVVIGLIVYFRGRGIKLKKPKLAVE